MLHAILYAAIISFASFGAGTLLALLWNDEPPPSIAELVVLGLAPITATGMVLNFFMPIRPAVGWWILGIATLSGIVHLFRSKIRWSDAALFTLSLIYFVKESLLSPIAYDTGLYHLQAVKWLELGSVIPGFSSIHSRLGYDSISLVAASMVHVANDWSGPLVLTSVFMAAITSFFLSYVLTNASDEEKLSSTSYACVVAVLLLLGRRFFELGSLSTDVIPAALILLIVFWMIRLAEGGTLPAYFLIFPVLAVAGKLSAAVVAAGCTLFYLVHTRPIPKRTTAAAAIFGGIWMARNAIASGYLAYPVCQTDLHLSWGLPRSHCELEQFWITSWARIPSADTSRSHGLMWIRPWFEANWNVRILDITAMIAFVGLIFLAKDRTRPRSYWSLCVIAFASLLVWFFSTPDLRFGTALLIAFSGILLAGGLPMKRLPLWAGAMLCLALIADIAYEIRHAPAEWPRVPQTQTTIRMLDGVPLRIPTDGPQCWAEDPPCTPYPGWSLPKRIAARIRAAREHSQ